MAHKTRRQAGKHHEIEVTDAMVEAAETALWEQAEKYNMQALDELHHDTVRLMIIAAISRMRTT